MNLIERLTKGAPAFRVEFNDEIIGDRNKIIKYIQQRDLGSLMGSLPFVNDYLASRIIEVGDSIKFLFENVLNKNIVTERGYLVKGELPRCCFGREAHIELDLSKNLCQISELIADMNINMKESRPGIKVPLEITQGMSAFDKGLTLQLELGARGNQVHLYVPEIPAGNISEVSQRELHYKMHCDLPILKSRKPDDFTRYQKEMIRKPFTDKQVKNYFEASENPETAARILQEYFKALPNFKK